MTIDSKGYPREGKRRIHITVAERALGKPLPKGVQVHHVDENKLDYSNSNLVICQDAGYHKLLHYRTRALDETGDADSVKCGYCRLWSDRTNPEIEDYSDGGRNRHRIWHKTCQRSYNRKRNGYRA